MDYIHANDDETFWNERRRLADMGFILCKCFEVNEMGIRQLESYRRNLAKRNIEHLVLTTSKLYQVLEKKPIETRQLAS